MLDRSWSPDTLHGYSETSTIISLAKEEDAAEHSRSLRHTSGRKNSYKLVDSICELHLKGIAILQSRNCGKEWRDQEVQVYHRRFINAPNANKRRSTYGSAAYGWMFNSNIRPTNVALSWKCSFRSCWRCICECSSLRKSLPNHAESLYNVLVHRIQISGTTNSYHMMRRRARSHPATVKPRLKEQTRYVDSVCSDFTLLAAPS